MEESEDEKESEETKAGHWLPQPCSLPIPFRPRFLPSISVELNDISDARLYFILTFKILNKYTDGSVIILYRKFTNIEAFSNRFCNPRIRFYLITSF